MKNYTNKFIILLLAAAALSFAGCAKNNKKTKTAQPVHRAISQVSSTKNQTPIVLQKGNPQINPQNDEENEDVSRKRTERGLLTPLPFTFIYDSPDSNTVPVFFASSLQAATYQKIDSSWYIVKFEKTDTCFGVTGYVQSDKVIEGASYVYNIHKTYILNKNGNSTGEILPAHTLLAWQKDEDGISTIYTFNDGTIQKKYIKSGNLCNYATDIEILFKYNQIKEAKDINDPLLYNLTKQLIQERYYVPEFYENKKYSDSELFTDPFRKEPLAVNSYIKGYYKNVDWDSYGIADRLYSASDAEKLEQYLSSDSITWGVFPKPSLQVSIYNQMCFIGSNIIEAGTLAATVKGSFLYFYVDSKTGNIQATFDWVDDQRPVMRSDFKDELETFAKIRNGSISGQKAKEAFWDFFESDKDYMKYNDPNFTRIVSQYRNKYYGTDYSENIKDYKNFKGTLTVAAKDKVSANIYSRPGTIGNIIGKAEEGKILKPLKFASHLYSPRDLDDICSQPMYFYFEIPDEETGTTLNGWISGSELVFSEHYKWTEGAGESENDESMYAGYSEDKLVSGYDPGHFFPSESDSNPHYNDKNLYEYSVGQDMGYFTVFNPDFHSVITDNPFGKPVIAYEDKELYNEAFVIPDLTTVEALAVCMGKYEEENSSYYLHAVKVYYNGKSGWIKKEDLFTNEKPFKEIKG